MRLAAELGHPPAIDGFFRAVWRVEPDPDYTEYISTPERQLALLEHAGVMVGDCDDAATMAACLLAAIEWPCRLVAVRLHKETEFSHVFCRAPLLEYGGGDFDIDPIVPAAALPLEGVAETLEVTVP